MTFAAYVAKQHPFSKIDVNTFGNDANLLESAAPTEGISPGLAKTAAIGILMRIPQLRATVVQDRNAGGAAKSIAQMMFLLASMLAVAIGAMNSDAELVKKAKGSGSR